MGKQGKKEAKKNFVNLFKDYCRCTTIHGVQYVGDSERPIFEKIFWIAVLMLCTTCNFMLIWRVWSKWQFSPVIVSYPDYTTPVWQVPFPAITICSQSNSKRHLFDFENGMRKKLNGHLDYSEIEKLSAMSVVCDPLVSINGSEIVEKHMINFLIEVAPSLEETMGGCKMGNKFIDCESIFRPIFTEDGLCFTSNVLNHSEIFKGSWSVEPYPVDLPSSEHWTLEKGYRKGSPIDTYPIRALNAGDKSGLLVVLSGNASNHDAICRGPIPGYKIILHNPAEVPTSSSKYIRVPMQEEILVWIQPNVMTTSDGLRSYSPSRRQCFYSDERELKYFKIYTERNCQLECLTNYTFEQCGCASIYMPRNQETPVCGGGKKECAINALYNLRIEEVKKNYQGLEKKACNCLPACTSITYQAETSQSDFDWQSTLSAIEEKMFQLEDFTMSRVTLFFTETHYTTIRRSELFGIIDFMANCGGLLGLFSGISFLSILEIFYFTTLRPYGNIRNEREKERVKMERAKAKIHIRKEIDKKTAKFEKVTAEIPNDLTTQ